MRKKMITGIVLCAALSASAAACMFAESTEKPDRVEVQEIAFDIPEDIRDLVTVRTEDLKSGELVSVSETASIEAAAKQTPDYERAGWIFSIRRVSETEFEQLRCGAMDGMEMFAESDDNCYLFCHPTDVTFVREQYDNVEEDMAQWSKIHEWANTTVRDEILRNNPELDAETVSNTQLDMLLARAAFLGERNFMIKSLEYGTLDPSKLADDDCLEDLTDDVIYKVLYKEEAPDGEYIVMDFEKEGLRYDFFLAEPERNLIREVYTLNGKEYTLMYQAVFKDQDETAVGIMQRWCDQLAKVQ